ncbi:MAG: VOC family protein [Actinomycetes bacterium]
MARVSTYLNFAGNTLAAFEFYAGVFGTEFVDPPQFMRDVPFDDHMPTLTEAEQGMVMHVELPILAGHLLMGTDAVETLGQRIEPGNNVTVNLEPDTRAEVDELFARLSDGGDPTQCMPPMEMFWGGYYATAVDKFGMRWMFNCAEAPG